MSLLLLQTLSNAHAGLAPPDVLVLYSTGDPEALGTAEAYAAARDLRPDQLCAVGQGLEPVVASISWDDFETAIREPFEACLDAQPDPAEIDALVLVRGLPYRVELPAYVASLDAVLQVHHATIQGEDLAGSGQADYNGTHYATAGNPVFVGDDAYDLGDFEVGRSYRELYTATSSLSRLEEWPASFDRNKAGRSGSIRYSENLFIVSRLDGFDHADARALIDRALAAEEQPPQAELLCMYGADEARGARDDECELATRWLTEAGHDGEWVAEWDAALSDHEVLLYLTGAADLTGAIDGLTYAPGAFADNLTSHGAHPQNFVCEGDVCPASEVQTSIARFVRAGATGTQGTVAEPLNNVFPHASLMLFYASGYSLGESMLYSQPYLYWQNLLIGDPLVVPFVERPVVTATSDGVDATHPSGIARLSLYEDGVVIAEGAPPLVLEPGTYELFAVARSGAVEVNGVLTQPEVTGWASLELTVEVPDTGDSGDTGSVPEPKGPEGCSGCGAGGLAWTWLALLPLLWRRR
ncbi:MAG: TIGR03790 family protein [Proteobacteria bacterium]|nr:TIGR03790 family protein [Pseudomonadota bacterium]